jgi:predicted GNAT family N-acyltransferase
MKPSYIIKCGFRIAILNVDKNLIDSNANFVIVRINVPINERRKGIGTELLKRCLKDAQKEQVSLCLEVLSSSDMSSGRLMQWYKKHGFISDAAHPEIMTWEPKIA